MTVDTITAIKDALEGVTKDEAIGFINTAMRNWSRLPKLDADDIQDLAEELQRFAERRYASTLESLQRENEELEARRKEDQERADMIASPQTNMTVVWTSQYQLDEALNCGMGYIYGAEGKPEKADIPLMRLADGGPAPSENLPLFGELPSPSPFTRKVGHTAADLVAKIAQVSATVGFQANEPAMEMAGQIVSVLAANPEHIDRFMAEGSELFLDGTLNHENGSLTYRAVNGSILSPSILREKKGQQQ